MKVIFVMSDSFRLDHLGCMGNKWIHTPVLDAFSKECATFTNTYAGSWATVPNRTDLLLGQYGFTERPWSPLKPGDITVGQELAGEGIPSQMVSDTANTISREYNLYRGFTAWFHNRGQEGDPWRINDDVPYKQECPLSVIRYTKERWHKILMNRSHRKVETDWFAPGTSQWAIEWLEQNYQRENFLLWIDMFDPHEPWDPPQCYVDLYDPGYKGRVMEAPTYGVRRKLDYTDRELKHTRARYAGEVTMVDRWFGRLLDTVDKLGIRDDTLIIFTSDHGHYLDYPSDGGLVGKPSSTGPTGTWAMGKDPSKVTHHPLYLSMVRQPLFIRCPKAKPRRISAVAQPCDITPTILDYFGIKTPERCHGQTLLPLIKGRKKSIRRTAFSGLHGKLSLVTNDRWSYCCWLGHRKAALWDRKKDPNQQRDVARKNPKVVKKMHAELVKFFKSTDTDEEYIDRHDPKM